jgi:hypothetical protein
MNILRQSRTLTKLREQPNLTIIINFLDVPAIDSGDLGQLRLCAAAAVAEQPHLRA